MTHADSEGWASLGSTGGEKIPETGLFSIRPTIYRRGTYGVYEPPRRV